MKVLFVVKKIILLINLIFITSFFTSHTYASHTSGSGEIGLMILSGLVK